MIATQVPHVTEDPQFSGYGYTASGTARRLRELFEDSSKFKVFAFISCLICPNAGKQFRRVLHHQKFRTERFKKTGRELKRGLLADSKLEKRIDRIVEIAEDLWWFPNATAHSISLTRPPFNPPHWAGDPPPTCVDIIPCVSRLVTADDFARLVKLFGYDPRAAWTSVTHAQLQPPSDRRRRVVRPDLSAREGDERREYNGAGFAQPLPYVGALSRGTKQGCGFTRRQVAGVVDEMRIDLPTRRAVAKIVYARLPLRVVAKAYGIKCRR
jgi:hypothetical protein